MTGAGRGFARTLAVALVLAGVGLPSVEAWAQEPPAESIAVPAGDPYLAALGFAGCERELGEGETVLERLCSARLNSALGRRDWNLAKRLIEAVAIAEAAQDAARPVIAMELADLLFELGERDLALRVLDRHVSGDLHPALAARAGMYRAMALMLPYPAPDQLDGFAAKLATLDLPQDEVSREAWLSGWRMAGFAALGIGDAQRARTAFEYLTLLAPLGPGVIGGIEHRRYALTGWRELARLALEEGDLSAAGAHIAKARAAQQIELVPYLYPEELEGVGLLEAEIALAGGAHVAELFPGELVGDPEAEWRPRADWNLVFDGETAQRREELLTLYRQIYEERGEPDLTSAPVIPDLPFLLSLAFEQAQSLSTSSADRAAQYANALRQVESAQERAQLEAYDRLRGRHMQTLRAYLALGVDADSSRIAGLLADLAEQRAALDGENSLSDIYEDYPGTAGRYQSILPWYLGFRLWDDVGQRENMLLIVPADGDIHVFAQGWTGDTGFAWHVVKDGVERIAPLVERLRCQVDQQSCSGDALFALDQLVLSPLEEAGQQAFDRQAAYELYQLLIEPVEPALTPGSDVFVMARGAMSTLPLALLVTAPPAPDEDWADYAAMSEAQWLGDRYAFTTTPSFLSFRPNRLFPLVDEADDMLFAVADPAFDGEERPGALRSADFLSLTREGRLANLDAIRRLSALPGTRAEFESISRALDPPAQVALLGSEAREGALRSHPDLARARYLLLATHGLLPRENLDAIVEPALVLTPPEEASAADDGLLLASEVRELTLRAEWVFLSACNTAAAGGTGDSLSELASAFLRAGALQVMASHWPVLDDVTPVLTTQTLRAAQANARGGPGRALQSAIATVRSGSLPDGSRLAGWREEWAHPMAWAPFVLISNGDEATVKGRFDTSWDDE